MQLNSKQSISHFQLQVAELDINKIRQRRLNVWATKWIVMQGKGEGRRVYKVDATRIISTAWWKWQVTRKANVESS